MDLQIVIFVWLAVGALVGFIGGKLFSRRHAGYLPFIAGGMIGASLVGFIVRGAFGADGNDIGEYISIAGSVLGAAGFVGLALLIPVKQTIPH